MNPHDILDRFSISRRQALIGGSAGIAAVTFGLPRSARLAVAQDATPATAPTSAGSAAAADFDGGLSRPRGMREDPLYVLVGPFGGLLLSPGFAGSKRERASRRGNGGRAQEQAVASGDHTEGQFYRTRRPAILLAPALPAVRILE